MRWEEWVKKGRWGGVLGYSRGVFGESGRASGGGGGGRGFWARHWAGKCRQIPACLPEKYGRSCVLPVKSRQDAGIWTVL